MAARRLGAGPIAPPDPLPPAVPPSWKAPTSGGSTGRPKIIVAGNAGVRAIVQLDSPVPDEELSAHLRSRLTGNKVPSTYERVDVPLRDDTGKIRRSALRAERISVPA